MAETTDELLARMAKKYGLSETAPSAGTPPAPTPKPQPQPQPAPQSRSLVDMIRDRKSAIDKATGYACGGKIHKMAQGGKIQGPGTPTSDSIPAQVQDTGEPIKVSTGERILSASQDAVMEEIARKLGFESLDALLEAETGKPVGPTVKGGVRAAETGMAPDELIHARGTPFNFDDFAKQQLYRRIAADSAAARASAAPPVAPTTAPAPISGGISSAAQRVASIGAGINPGGLGAVTIGSSIARGIDDAINSIRNSGNEPYKPSSLVNMIPDERGASSIDPRERLKASAPSPAPSIKTPPDPAPNQNPKPDAGPSPSGGDPSNDISRSIVSGIKTFSGKGTPTPGPDVMGLYKNASDIYAQTIGEQSGPKVSGIRDPGPAESLAFDNFLARSSIQSAMEAAAKSGDPRRLQTVPGLAAQLGALSGQIPAQDLARDQLNQQGDIKRQELAQDARYKGAQVGIGQDEAKAKGLQASASVAEQTDRAANNALTRDIGRLELGQKQQRDGLLQKALAGDQAALAQLSAINLAEKGAQGKWQVARIGSTDAAGNQTTSYDLVNDATGEVRKSGGQAQQFSRADVEGAIKRGADPKAIAERIRAMGQDPKNFGL